MIVLFPPIITELFPEMVPLFPQMIVDSAPWIVFSDPPRMVDLSEEFPLIRFLIPPKIVDWLAYIWFPLPPMMVLPVTATGKLFLFPPRIEEFFRLPVLVFPSPTLVRSDPLMVMIPPLLATGTCPAVFHPQPFSIGLGIAKIILVIRWIGFERSVVRFTMSDCAHRTLAPPMIRSKPEMRKVFLKECIVLFV